MEEDRAEVDLGIAVDVEERLEEAAAQTLRRQKASRRDCSQKWRKLLGRGQRRG